MPSSIKVLFQIILFTVQTILAFVTGYLVLLTNAAVRAVDKTDLTPKSPTKRFLILIPAHNEEQLLGDTLDSLSKVCYPPALFSVHVVADNCSDQTAAIAEKKGAVVHVRTHSTLIGKGYALQWLLKKLWSENVPHDALVFLDADSVVSPNFLQIMDARLTRGEQVIQAYYAVRSPEKYWNSALRFAAFAVLHYLRPQARMVLGGSAGLKGNGMVFAAEVMKQYEWSGSLTEDIEMHMALLLGGQRVTFAPDAVVYGEMPGSLKKMQSQHMRWEQGRLETSRRYIPLLLKSSHRDWRMGNKQGAFLHFDAAMEHFIPPFSILAGLTGLGLFVNLLTLPRHQKTSKPTAGEKLASLNLILSIGLVMGQLAYLLTGLRLVHASKSIYSKFLYAPILVVWKLKQYIEAILTRKQSVWVRTARNGGDHGTEQVEPERSE